MLVVQQQPQEFHVHPNAHTTSAAKDNFYQNSFRVVEAMPVLWTSKTATCSVNQFLRATILTTV